MQFGWRRGAALLVTTFAVVGCNAGDPTGATPVTELIGPTWRLTTMTGQPVMAGTTVTATFSNDARVTGSAGCNGYFGRAQAEAGKLEMGPFGSTLMACYPDGVLAQESKYLATLDAVTRYEVRGSELRLGPTASETTLVFTR